MYDVLIKNSTIIDGTKKDKFQADIAILKGKIKKIGKLGMQKAN